MKTRFTTLDIISEVRELESLIGMRINQIYDVDNRTYLFKLQKPESKAVLLLESGVRIHQTNFERSKNPAPSGFSMKLRKHLKNKRLESIRRICEDRIIELSFGSGEAEYKVILELYDKGNIVLTDKDYLILNILRPRLLQKDNPDQKLVVKEYYPRRVIEENTEKKRTVDLKDIFSKAKPNDNLKKVLVHHFPYGPALLEHFLLDSGISPLMKAKDITDDVKSTIAARVLNEEIAEKVLISMKDKKAIILQKVDGDLLTYSEFHPFKMKQHEKFEDKLILEFPSFDTCIDEFFSKIEGQKIDLKTLQQEKLALKKLENVKKDHSERINKLKKEQDLDRRKGELVEMNNDLVENALKIMRTLLADQISWKEIQEFVDNANDNPVVKRIVKLKLETNNFSIHLSDPYAELYSSDEEENSSSFEGEVIDIDIELSAQANARKYYVQKKAAAVKAVKTLESHSVAIKSAERKTKQALKEVATISTIIKARKVFWFEKFYWFISSENYLVIGGRDGQQNELIVKRYMKSSDIYVHADLYGASSVLIKNPTGKPIPPKTLNEAGTMAVCYSAAWDSKLVTNAWWVYSSQVTKSAPTGEYLTTGSFIIRGKKNFLPPCYLILGFGFLFKLEEASIPRHINERRVRNLAGEHEEAEPFEDESEIRISDEDDGNVSEKRTSGISFSIKEEEQGECMDAEQGDNSTISERLKDENINIKESERKDEVKDRETSCPEDEHNKVSNEDFSSNSVRKNKSTAEKNFNVESVCRKDIKNEDEKKETVTERESNNSSSSSDEKVSKDEEVQFPDTNIEIGYSASGEMKVKVGSSASKAVWDESFKPTSKKDCQPLKSNSDHQAPKRGKKGKLKKLKEKYKDQDEEEKEIRMKLLQGRSKEGTSKKKERLAAAMEKEAAKKAAKARYNEILERKNKQKAHTDTQQTKKAELDEDLDFEEEKITVPDEIDMLDSLTGIPVEEDELLFCLPVVAPYQVLTNYKFKVKVTPGTNKKGKATKTALQMFSSDKASSLREKDLLKSLKDQDLSRNLPGKVKLSGSQVSKIKTKK